MKDKIMQRMKENYETRSRSYLLRRTPVVIRIDGKAFHTYTKGLVKPFDEGLIEDMQETTKYLCENIQGAVLGYTQSDEISILLNDFAKLESQAWFNYEVQKICSIAASLATSKFNELRIGREFTDDLAKGGYKDACSRLLFKITEEQFKLANFDARAFNLPKEEVGNYFYARQKDAVKNSISMLAQALYSHKELQGKNGSEMQELTFQKGHNWNDLHFSKKRGTTFRKYQKRIETENGEHYRKFWNIDENQFKFNNEYFKDLLCVE